MTATTARAPFRCEQCGDEWPTDPRLGVPCPTCQAPVGAGCRRPSEHAGHFVQPHAARRKAAFKVNPCACLARWEAAQGRAR